MLKIVRDCYVDINASTCSLIFVNNGRGTLVKLNVTVYKEPRMQNAIDAPVPVDSIHAHFLSIGSDRAFYASIVNGNVVYTLHRFVWRSRAFVDC